MACHCEGAFAPGTKPPGRCATEESLLSGSEILRYAQDDIFEMTRRYFVDQLNGTATIYFLRLLAVSLDQVAHVRQEVVLRFK